MAFIFKNHVFDVSICTSRKAAESLLSAYSTCPGWRHTCTHFGFFTLSLVLQFEITEVACPVGEEGLELVPSAVPDGPVHRVCIQKRRVSSGTN